MKIHFNSTQFFFVHTCVHSQRNIFLLCWLHIIYIFSTRKENYVFGAKWQGKLTQEEYAPSYFAFVSAHNSNSFFSADPMVYAMGLVITIIITFSLLFPQLLHTKKYILWWNHAVNRITYMYIYFFWHTGTHFKHYLHHY